MDKFQMISEFKSFLRKGKVEFLYLKKDGTARFAYGTMCPEFLPKVEPKEVDETTEAKPKRKLKEGMIFYYDLEKGGYRSFHEDNLLSFFLILRLATVSTATRSPSQSKRTLKLRFLVLVSDVSISR